jgi:putative molybdopterin biosynthesis protein
MSIYLHDIPLAVAKKIIEDELTKAGLWCVLGSENIVLDEQAVGRVLTRPLHAKISAPNYNSSAMDGFAVSSEETSGAKPASPISLLFGKQCRYVDTGDPIPNGFNSVIPIEEVEPINGDELISPDPRNPESIRIRASVVPWRNIRPLGEDIVISQLIYPRGHIIKPVDLGVIAAAGYSSVDVNFKPKVAIIPTGSELIPIGTTPRIGEILETNSIVLAGKINQWGAEATRLEIVPDNFEEVLRIVMKSSEKFDLILLNAGSSAGSEDYSSAVIEKAGTLFFHGVAVRPGHPVIFGIIENGNRKIPVIGVPGFPVSAILTLDIFIKEIVATWVGKKLEKEEIIKARVTQKITSPAGDDDFVRVVMAKIGGEYLAAPLHRGAGVISSLSKADGLLVIPSGVQGLEEGEKVNITFQRTKDEIEHTIMHVGSHDLILDELTQFLFERGRRLVSINVGSIGGLIALNRGVSHLAGAHLLDSKTGEYNLSYINKYISNYKIMVISLAMREQGLLIKKNNPKKITNLEDLLRKDIRFINRQRGAGTRILLDYHLDKNNIPTESINGYYQEEYTHLGISAAVISGRADCGLGIAAAALPYDLDFIPLFNERYDLIINKQFNENGLLNPLIELLNDGGFKKYISKMNGYDISIMGNVILEGD